MECQRYGELFDLYPDACLITTRHYQIEDANPAAQALLSLTGYGLIGQSLSNFVIHAEKDRFLQRVLSLQEPNVCVPAWEMTLQNDHYQPFLAKLIARGFHESEGNVKIYWCIQDLRQRQAAIQALRQVNRSLDDEVRRQTQELTEVNSALQNKIRALKQTQKALKTQTNQERLIDAITHRIYQAVGLDEILDTSVSEVRRFLNVDRVLIYRFKPDWSGTVTVESVAPGAFPILYTKIDEPCFRSQYVNRYQQGRVRAIEDIYTEGLGACHLELLSGFQVRANLVVPILREAKLWGLLIAHHCKGPRAWEPIEIDLLSKLVIQMGIAIHQAELYQKWQQLATIDGLTEVANRRRFNDYLEDIWHQRKNGKPLTLVLADIDFFKQYNDTYGHPAGDQCLKQVAQAMGSVFQRAEDLVARYGGEEFAMLLPETDLEEALGLVTKLRTAIRTLNIEHRRSPFERVTLSFGLACVEPQSNASPQALIDAADQALYQAKANGRNGMAIPTALEKVTPPQP